MKKGTGEQPPIQSRGIDNNSTSSADIKESCTLLSHFSKSEHRRKISESMKKHWERVRAGEPAPRKDRSEYTNPKVQLPKGAYAKCSCGVFCGSKTDFEIHSRFCEIYQAQHEINRLGSSIDMVQKGGDQS